MERSMVIKMKCKQWIKILAVPFGLILWLFLMVVLENLADIRQEEDPTAEVQMLAKDIYNGYGLKGGEQLSTEVTGERNGIIRYSDRWLVRFKGTEDNIRRARGIVSDMRIRYPVIRNFYVLPVPPRIVTEQGYEEEREKYLAYMEQFGRIFSGTAQVVDVLPVLEEEADQYLFFRTEDSWTAKGALYGARVLCEALAIEPFPLEAYYEYMYSEFLGSLYGLDTLTEEETEELAADPVFYYVLPDAKNRETILSKDGKINKSPVFTPSASGMATFAGVGKYAVIEGDGQNEETKDKAIMLICDSSGRLLASYLANYYGTVYVVDIQEYGEFYDDMSSILSAYGIEDIVWAQSAQSLGAFSYSRALNRFSDE